MHQLTDSMRRKATPCRFFLDLKFLYKLCGGSLTNTSDNFSIRCVESSIFFLHSVYQNYLLLLLLIVMLNRYIICMASSILLIKYI